MAGNVTIGMAAKRTGLSPRAIRYYEDKGLLPPRPRTVGGYRQYGEADVKSLLFIRRAKDLGISLRQISALLDCWPESTCAMSRPLLKKTLAGARRGAGRAARPLGRAAGAIETGALRIGNTPLLGSQPGLLRMPGRSRPGHSRPGHRKREESALIVQEPKEASHV